MKQIRILFLLAVCIVSLQAMSQETFTVGNLKYTIISNYSKTVSVGCIDNTLSGDVVIPETVTYNGTTYSVTSIIASAFYDCRNIISVSIPNSVNSIGGQAFTYCNGLTAVHITDMTAWCNISFNSSNSNPLTYAHHLFLNGTEVHNLVIPNTITTINSCAFCFCESLSSITIPNSVVSIENDAFEGCNNLISVYLGNSINAIKARAFRDCSNLLSINLPNGIKTIGDESFLNCSSLVQITIPNSVEDIGFCAFLNCRSINTVTVGNGVFSIGRMAFRQCSSLTQLTLGNNVNRIKEHAFYGCSNLPSLTLPSSVSIIGSQAFDGCANLMTITSLRETPGTLADDAFPDYNVPLYVPAGCISNYMAADGWKQFTNIQEIGGGGVTNKCATPTISFGGKKLSFDCETEGVEYITEIKDADIGMFYDDQIMLSATYEISVIATKAGYENSNKATATLVWNNATFTDTTPQTGIKRVPQSHDLPMLIQSNEGTVTVQGAGDGTLVSIYNSAGQMTGSAISNDGKATVFTNMKPGAIAIVKIGGEAVKIMIK